MWEWENGSGWEAYPPAIQAKLERAYTERRRSSSSTPSATLPTVIDVGGEREVNLDFMVQTSKRTSHHRLIRRRDDGGLPIYDAAAAGDGGGGGGGADSDSSLDYANTKDGFHPLAERPRKIVVVGDGNDGKSVLIHVFAHKSAPSRDAAVTNWGFLEANCVVDVTFEDEQVALAFWDTPGQEDYCLVRPTMYVESAVILVVYSIVAPDSFDNIQDKVNVLSLSLSHCAQKYHVNPPVEEDKTVGYTTLYYKYNIFICSCLNYP